MENTEKIIKRQQRKQAGEKILETLFLLSATISILGIALILYMIFSQSAQLFGNYNLADFLFGTKWNPRQGVFGILPMIVASLLITGGALLIGVPIGVGCAIFMAEKAGNGWLAALLRRAVELLAGIPSVVYGFFGLMVIVPFLKAIGPPYISGLSLLAAALLLGIMILPIIISMSENAIRAVPREFKEGSLALGASHWQTIRKVLLPGARSGILAAVVLGVGRAVGETMAVILIAGNTVAFPQSLFSPVRTLTVNIVLEMSYVEPGSLHYSAQFATAAVLFVFILLLNLLLTLLVNRAKKRGV